MQTNLSSDVQRTINALKLVQGLISNDSSIKNDIQPHATRVNIAVHIGALVLAGIILLIELGQSGINTELVLLSKSDSTVLVVGLGNIAVTLVLLALAFYFLIVQSAKKSNSSFQEYVQEHFQYLSNFSFLTDLFVKFVVLALILIAPRPEWMAPLLSLFIGDYLFQGRFFVLPLPLALVSGALCFVASAIQLYSGDPSLMWPLILFLAVCSVSLIQLYSFYRIRTK